MLLLLSVVSFCPGEDGHPCLGEDGHPCLGEDGLPCLGEDGLPCLGEDGLPRLGEDGLVYHSLAPLALGRQLGEALGDDLR